MDASGNISLIAAKQLFLLSKVIVEKFGKPKCFVTSAEDGGLSSAKVINLICGVCGIQSTSAFNAKTPNRSTLACLSLIFKESAEKDAEHTLLVVPHETFSRLMHQNIAVGNSCTIAFENWETSFKDYQSLWFPLNNNALDPVEAGEIADKLFNTPLSASEAILVEKAVMDSAVII